ncbi:MAG: glycine zipper 2TM domain-containing protein [Pseudomonadota bacterium]
MSLPHDSSVAVPATAHPPVAPASAALGTPAHRHSSPLPTWAWLAGAAMLAAIVGLTTALVQRAGEEARAQQADPLAALSAPGAGDPDARPGAERQAPAGLALTAADTAPAGTRPSSVAPRHAAPRTASGTAGTQPPADERRSPSVAAARCSSCGTVESVRAVQVAGQGTGLGAVAGGVVGGVVGNQFGKGSGNTAMTVLGAVGGGYAGHQIEKRARSQTVYQVRVRMSDGSLRTVQSSTAWSVGAPVRVEGNQLRSDTTAS